MSTYNKTVQKRIKIGISIVKENQYNLDWDTFTTLYKKALIKENISVPKDPRTIESDIKKIVSKIYNSQYEVEDLKGDKGFHFIKPYKAYNRLYKRLKSRLNYVYIKILDNEYLIYDSTKKRNKNYELFKNLFTSLKEKRKSEMISKDNLIKIYFILDSNDSFREELADFYDKYGSSNVLYTSIHSYCVEIVSKINYLVYIFYSLKYSIFQFKSFTNN